MRQLLFAPWLLISAPLRHLLTLLALMPVLAAAETKSAFPLKVSNNHRHLVDAAGQPFFVLADTPWFIQKVKLDDVRRIMDDRVAKGFNTLSLETVDDSNVPSRDGYGRFMNLMWMGVGDMNPNARQLESARILGRTLRTAAPHHLQTTHMANEFSSARFFNDEPWLDVNLAYTYAPAHCHVAEEYARDNPVRPVILSETGYESMPNYNEKLPDGKKGGLWNPFTIRRQAWWAVTSGASGFCTGSRMWEWKSDWPKWLDCESAKQVPHLRTALETIAWWKLMPDTQHAFLVAGAGDPKQVDFVTAAQAEDGSCAVVYSPAGRAFTLDLSKPTGAVTARWLDPSSGKFQPVAGSPFANASRLEFTPPGKNTAGESDWTLLLESSTSNSTLLK